MSDHDTSKLYPDLNGWHRWGSWAAHFFISGKQICNTQHTFTEGGFARGLSAARPEPAPLAPCGLPFGRICTQCANKSK